MLSDGGRLQSARPPSNRTRGFIFGTPVGVEAATRKGCLLVWRIDALWNGLYFVLQQNGSLYPRNFNVACYLRPLAFRTFVVPPRYADVTHI